MKHLLLLPRSKHLHGHEVALPLSLPTPCGHLNHPPSSGLLVPTHLLGLLPLAQLLPALRVALQNLQEAHPRAVVA